MSQRKLRVGMVGGGGPSNFFGAPHRRGDPDGQLGRADRRRAAEQGRGVDRRGPRAVHAPRLSRLAGDDQGGRPPCPNPSGSTTSRSSRPTTPTSARPTPRRPPGIGVLCEKPLTTTLDEARRLHATVRSKERPFVVAYTYTGFPMVMLARELVHDGEIGEIRKVEAWYPQGWLATKLEADNQKQAAWRVDPAKAGGSGCGGDIGTHAYEFVRFVAGLSATRLRARLKTFVPGRALDDDFTVLAELNNGAIATITASQVTIGAQNDNGFRDHRHDGDARVVDDRSHWCSSTTPAASRCGSTARGPSTAISPASVKPYLRLPSGPPRGLPRGAGQPAPDARMDDPRPPRRDRSPSPSSTPASPTASPAWPSSRPPSPAPSRTANGSRCPRIG